ncbi:MAG: GNAT family N-acetyltransferase [Planctomycetota bacterium]|nr:GNAT family N-acetyltransferase [Planctomycetota bacterium]
MRACSDVELEEEVRRIHGGRPERFSLPCSFGTGPDGKRHALLQRAGTTVCVGSTSVGDRAARLIAARLDRPRPSPSELADLLQELGGPAPMVLSADLGPVAGEAAGMAWGLGVNPRLHLALYRYDGPPDPCRANRSGSRRATREDVRAVADFMQAFDTETDYHSWSGSGDRIDFTELAERSLESSVLHLIEQGGRPVAIGQRARTSSAGQNRIGSVYVDPAHRRRGLGASVVMSLVGEILAEGAVPCLFTQQSDPASNGLYRTLDFTETERLVHLEPTTH